MKRQPIKTSVQNSCNLAHVVLINFGMRMVDFDFYFVEDTFGANEEPTVRGVSTPYDSGCTVNLNAQILGLIESLFRNPSVTSSQGLVSSGCYDVEAHHFVHAPSISRFGVSVKTAGEWASDIRWQHALCALVVVRLEQQCLNPRLDQTSAGFLTSLHPAHRVRQARFDVQLSQASVVLGVQRVGMRMVDFEFYLCWRLF